MNVNDLEGDAKRNLEVIIVNVTVGSATFLFKRQSANRTRCDYTEYDYPCDD